MMTIPCRAAVIGALLVVVACGGGGSGGGPSVSDVPLPVDSPTTAQSLAGGTPFTASSSQIENAFRTEARQASRLLYDIQDFDFPSSSIRSSCRGVTCNTAYGQVSTSDFAQSASVPGLTFDSAYQPLMRLNGVRLFQGRGQAKHADYPNASIDAVSLGGWMDYNAFGGTVTAVYEGPQLEGYTVAFIEHVSAGAATGQAPISTSGTATWRGSMVGADLEFRHALVGTSTVTLDLSSLRADVAMSNIIDVDARTRLSDISWLSVPVRSDGTLVDARNTLQASFYGPNHEEVGGIFTTSTIKGAFGAERQ